MTVRIDDLRPGFFYVFEARWLSSYGQGPPSEKTPKLTTLPSSPPVKPALEYPDPYSVFLTWDDPHDISDTVPAVVLEGFKVIWTGKERLPVHSTAVLSTIATTPSTNEQRTTTYLPYAETLLREEKSSEKSSIDEVFVEANNITIGKLDPATHY